MHITGVVLAGGKSQRMGQNKAYLQRFDQSMLDFTVEILAAVGVDQIVINANQPHPLHYQRIADVHPDAGPLSGIHAVMHTYQGQTDALLCMPIDMPCMQIASLQALLNQGRETRQIVHMANHPLPLFIPCSDVHFMDITERVTYQKGLSVRHFAQSHLAHVLSTETQAAWTNTNTPEQWDAALQNLSINAKHSLNK
jgi:molybdopterin-guanine dinucleotide biosynthesis protein A